MRCSRDVLQADVRLRRSCGTTKRRRTSSQRPLPPLRTLTVLSQSCRALLPAADTGAEVGTHASIAWCGWMGVSPSLTTNASLSTSPSRSVVGLIGAGALEPNLSIPALSATPVGSQAGPAHSEKAEVIPTELSTENDADETDSCPSTAWACTSVARASCNRILGRRTTTACGAHVVAPADSAW